MNTPKIFMHSKRTKTNRRAMKNKMHIYNNKTKGIFYAKCVKNAWVYSIKFRRSKCLFLVELDCWCCLLLLPQLPLLLTYTLLAIFFYYITWNPILFMLRNSTTLIYFSVAFAIKCCYFKIVNDTHVLHFWLISTNRVFAHSLCILIQRYFLFFFFLFSSRKFHQWYSVCYASIVS